MLALRQPLGATTSGSLQQPSPSNTKLQLTAFCDSRQPSAYLYELPLLW